MESRLKYRLEELVDVSLLQSLQDKLNEIYSFPSAIIDLDGKILTAVAWQDLCTKFHRINPQTEKDCIKSDSYIMEHMHEANPSVTYQCPRGLVDNATPIIIEGQHIANFFVGQYFFEKPDVAFFRKQAKEYGFNEQEYLKALTQVPVRSKEQVEKFSEFIIDFVELIARLGLRSLKEKEINEKISISEERFRLVIENSLDMVTLCDSDARYNFYSGPKKYEIAQSDILGKTPYDFYDKDAADKIVKQIKRTVETGEHKKFEVYTNWQGKMTWFEKSIYPLKKGDEITSVVKISRDITDRKKQEIELLKAKEKAEENETRFRILAKNVPGAIYLCKNDKHFSMIYLNDLVEELTGYKKEAFLCKEVNFPELYHEEDINQIYEKVEKALSNKSHFHLQYRLKHKSGNYIWIEEFGSGVFENDNLLFLEGIMFDITDRYKKENELIESRRKAEEANRLKTEFLNNMSHEIRTPMNGIIGFSELLNLPDISDEKRRYYSKIIQNSSQQLLRIIDDILEISTLETKQVRLNETEFCLNDLLMELFSNFNLKSKERNIPLYLKKGLNNENSQITSDKTKLNKILSNLLDNALKFTSEGFIEFGYYIDKANLVFYVKDTGIGISTRNYEMIFERFSQEDKEISRKHGGLGLGLSICKENTDLLGGTIKLESEKDKGSTFYVTIPYKPLNKKHNHLYKSTHEDLDQNAKYTILVAEDEEVNYLYAEVLFEDKTEGPYNIIHAKNGLEALEICKTRKNIDLVLMDIKMPVMGGIEAAKQIKSKFPNLPIIAQTAYSTETDKAFALKNGCDDFISKPINKEMLFGLINKYLESK